MENLFNTFSYDVWHEEQDEKTKKSRKRNRERQKKFKDLIEETKSRKEAKKIKKKNKKEKRGKKKKKKKKLLEQDSEERAEERAPKKQKRKRARSTAEGAGATLNEAQMQQLLAALSLQQEEARLKGEDTTAIKMQIQHLHMQTQSGAAAGVSGVNPNNRKSRESGTDDSSMDSNDEDVVKQLVELMPEHQRRRGNIPAFKRNILPSSIQDKLGRPVVKPTLGKIGRSASEGLPRDSRYKFNRTPSPKEESEVSSDDDDSTSSDDSYTTSSSSSYHSATKRSNRRK